MSITSNIFNKEVLVSCRQMSFLMNSQLGPICRKWDVTPQQLYVLSELSSNPDQTVTQLCDNVGILRTNFAMLCKKMEAQGLIVKTQSPIDRRSFTLAVTEEGRILTESIDADLKQQLDPFLVDVPDQVFQDLEAGLKAVETLISYFPEQERYAPTHTLLSRRAQARMRKAQKN